MPFEDPAGARWGNVLKLVHIFFIDLSATIGALPIESNTDPEAMAKSSIGCKNNTAAAKSSPGAQVESAHSQQCHRRGEGLNEVVLPPGGEAFSRKNHGRCFQEAGRGKEGAFQ